LQNSFCCGKIEENAMRTSALLLFIVQYDAISGIPGCGESSFKGDVVNPLAPVSKKVKINRWPWVASIRQNERGRGKVSSPQLRFCCTLFLIGARVQA